MIGAGRLAGVVLVCGAVACGKKGPPLPPLVRLPAAPAEVTAERRGSQIAVRFLTPAANTDGSRPAEIARVEVYAVTTEERVADDQWIARGEKVGSVDVRTPPEEESDAGTSSDVAPQGAGIDQGARASIVELLDRGAAGEQPASGGDVETWTPLAGQFAIPLLAPSRRAPRAYAAVGVTRRGRRGPLSGRAAVSLAPAPSAPGPLDITYTETELTIGWAAETPEVSSPSDGGDVLPSRPLVVSAARSLYHVYEAQPGGGEQRLTAAPSADRSFVDQRMTWGSERCYLVRAVAISDGQSTEGDPSARQCVALADTFAPAPPQGLTAISSEGAIGLIWEPGRESDLAGYHVSRDVGETGAFTRVTPEPIRETTFRDEVSAGAATVYVVQAIDKAGNASVPSRPARETAR